MSTINKWQMAKTAALSTLPPNNDLVYITSVGDFEKQLAGHKAGVTVMVTRDTAANMIASGHYQVSSPKDIADHDEAEKKLVAAHDRAKPLPVTSESIMLAATHAANAAASAAVNKKENK